MVGILIAFFWPAIARAHCPLCTLGAGAVAVGASWLGVSNFSVGIFIGAFGLAMGLWMAKLLKWPKEVLGLLSLTLTVFPLLFLFPGHFFWYIAFLNQVFSISWFMLGSALGAILVWLSPLISQKIKPFPYRGVIITFSLLILVSLTFELWWRFF